MRLERYKKLERLALGKPKEEIAQKEGNVNIKYCKDIDEDKDQKTPLSLDVGRSLQI